MTSHNFHTDCPKGWRYVGDVNLEYGGTFFKVADLEAFAADPVANDSVEVVRVEDTPWGWWLIESASLYLKGRTLGAEGLSREYSLNLADLEADPLLLAQLEALFVLSVWGLEDPARMAVLIGAAGNMAERDMFGDWHLVKNGLQPTPPLTKLPGNARLANYVRANYLKV